MRFAILGNHPDGLAAAAAFVASGRHELTGQRTDVEEVLADPAVDFVIVAGGADHRGAQLRRALQSERHVLCVYPPGPTPDIAYETDMIRKDTGRILMPLLPGSLHPAILRLAEFIQRPSKESDASTLVGAFRLLEMEQASPSFVDSKAAFAGWDLLRGLGGDIVEVSALAVEEHVEPGDVVLASGRFQNGGLFQVVYIPDPAETIGRLTVAGDRGRAELVFPAGWHGPAFLDWRDATGELREEAWDAWDPWPILVERFEAAIGGATDTPTWMDAVRGLELDDAARRSVERRRSSIMEYQEASEEIGFKGTMTLVGCGLLWGMLLIIGVSFWYPLLRWLIVVLLVVFLSLQFLRYMIPPRRNPKP